jgi:hypothetical protein
MLGERDGGGRVAPAEMVVFAVLLTLAVALAAAQAMHNMNPDGIAYIRLARYWRAGETGLAISAYWAPLFPWLTALFEGGPTAAMPTLGARVAMAVSAWFFGMVAMLWLWGVLPRRGQRVLAGAVLVLLAADFSTATVTPDLLLAGWILLAAWVLARADWADSPRLSFAAGLCLGAAFLTKAVALPTGLLLVLAACALELWRGRRLRALLSPCLFLLLGLLVLAGPQVAAMSLHEGAPVISSAGRINHALVGPGSDYEHPFMQHYYPVPAGRVTTWEDPRTEDYADWSPMASGAAMVFQARLVVRNALFTLAALRGFDMLCLGLVGGVVAVLAVFAGQGDRRQAMAAAVIVATVLPYLPVFAGEQRYYLAAAPMLLHLGFATGAAIGAGATTGWRRMGGALGPVLVALSFGLGVLPGAAQAFAGRDNPGYVQAEALSAAMGRLHLPKGGVAALGLRNTAALYLAFLQDTAFHGQKTALGDGVELRRSGARYVIATQAAEVDMQALRQMGTELYLGVPGLRVFRLDG